MLFRGALESYKSLWRPKGGEYFILPSSRCLCDERVAVDQRGGWKKSGT